MNKDDLQSFFSFFFGQLDLPLFTHIDAPIVEDKKNVEKD